MTQKRILRATMRKVVRERDLRIRDTFGLYAEDPDDPKLAELIAELVDDDPGATALAYFDIANRLLAQLAEATGSTPDEALTRAMRG